MISNSSYFIYFQIPDAAVNDTMATKFFTALSKGVADDAAEAMEESIPRTPSNEVAHGSSYEKSISEDPNYVSKLMTLTHVHLVNNNSFSNELSKWTN